MENLEFTPKNNFTEFLKIYHKDCYKREVLAIQSTIDVFYKESLAAIDMAVIQDHSRLYKDMKNDDLDQEYFETSIAEFLSYIKDKYLSNVQSDDDDTLVRA